MLAKPRKDNLIRFRCHECNKKLKATPDIIGRKVKCTRCPNVERVPPTDRLEKFTIKAVDEDEIRGDSDDDFAFLLGANDAADDVIKISLGKNSDDVDQLNPDEHQSDPSHSEIRLEIGSPSIKIDSGKLDSDGSRDSIGDFDFNGATDSDRKFVGNDFARVGAKPANQELMKRLLVFGVAVLTLAVIGAGFFFGASYLFSGPKFDTAFEELGEVFHYRAAKLKLEKSGRQMGVVGRAYVAMQNASPEVLAEMEKLEASVASLTTESLVLVEAYELYQKGESGVAKTLIADATKLMDAKRIEVDLKMNNFMGKETGEGEPSRQ